MPNQRKNNSKKQNKKQNYKLQQNMPRGGAAIKTPFQKQYTCKINYMQ